VALRATELTRDGAEESLLSLRSNRNPSAACAFGSVRTVGFDSAMGEVKIKKPARGGLFYFGVP